jgi:hypothetical protein
MKVAGLSETSVITRFYVKMDVGGPFELLAGTQ